MEHRGISRAVISRLPRYYRYLGDLLEEGVERISSGDLSKKMHVTASQIRQDLNNFGGFGQQGYGYIFIRRSERYSAWIKIITLLLSEQEILGRRWQIMLHLRGAALF